MEVSVLDGLRNTLKKTNEEEEMLENFSFFPRGWWLGGPVKVCGGKPGTVFLLVGLTGYPPD